MARGSVKAVSDEKGRVIEYVVRYDAPSPDGKRRQRQERCRTKKAADALLGQRLEEIRTGEYVEGTTETVGSYLLRWVESNPDWRAATRRSYRSMVKLRITPHLGAIRLSRLSEPQVAGWVAALQAAKYAPSTIATTHSALHAALEQAVRWRLVVRNAADGTKLPKIPDPVSAAWSVAEARAFLGRPLPEGKADPAAALWRLALDSGMRPGELLALKWGDVDWERGQVAVRRTITTAEDGRKVVGETTKRERSRRTIGVGADTLAGLRSHRARQAERRLAAGAAWTDEGLVFDRGDGRPMANEVMAGRLRRAAKAAKVPPITPHGLRHTCATLLLAAGVHPKIVQERLGHATIGETMDRYSHVLQGMQEPATEAMAAILGGAPCADGARTG